MNSFTVPNLNLVSENDPDFETKASPLEKRAVAMAARNAGVVEVGKNWERTATPQQREARRQESLRLEKKTEDTDYAVTEKGEIRAKYKIEITFAGPDPRHNYKGRTSSGPNRLGIQLWESGKHFHGGGDELMYWCQDNREGEDAGCWAPISGSNIVGEVAYCPNCERTVAAELLTNMKIGNVTTQNLAKECVKLFRQLGSNADIYCKYHKSDVHYIAMERAKGPEVAARLKGMHIYPLKNILKDTAFGADITKRFFTFFTS